jgi:glycosyltransferase involved in cell wall biosynthesis
MKILLVNYRYFVSGGPERYMFGVTELLERAGHEVVPFSVRYSENRATPWAKYFAEPIAGEDEVYFRDHGRSPRSIVRSLQRAFYAPDVYARVSELVRVVKPDVALVLHFQRKLSPSVLVALRDAGVPIVVRLSDFGMVCPAANLLRDGQVCRLCITHGLRNCVRYCCVQDSLGVSAVAAASLWFARRRGYFSLAGRFIAPSATLREQMIAGGYDASRIVVVPTFVDAARFAPDRVRERRIAFVGRLSPVKGIEVLLEAFEGLQGREDMADLELVVAGSGEPAYAARLRERARAISPRIRFVGTLDDAGVRDLLSSAMMSVVASLCYDNLPNAILESLAAGTPVAASDLGSMAEVLRGTDAGFLFPPGDPRALADGLARALSRPDTLARMSRSAVELARGRYSPESHLADLLGVLQGSISRGRGRGAR